jgi:hypothetical protein
VSFVAEGVKWYVLIHGAHDVDHEHYGLFAKHPPRRRIKLWATHMSAAWMQYARLYLLVIEAYGNIIRPFTRDYASWRPRES